MLSIIIPTFKAPTLLRRAIDSLIHQTSFDWECIVCPDDGYDYSYLLALDSRIYIAPSCLIATGAGAARNRGLPYVRGLGVGLP